MTETTMEYSAEFTALQEALQAPFTEINSKITDLTVRQSDTANQLHSLTTDDLATLDGIAKQKALTEMLDNIKLALQRARKQKQQIAVDNQPAARQTLSTFYNQMRQDLTGKSSELFGGAIDEQVEQLRSLVDQREEYERNTNADYEQQAFNWYESLYGGNDFMHARLNVWNSRPVI